MIGFAVILIGYDTKNSGVYFISRALYDPMSDTGAGRPYHELVTIIDKILDACDDDVPCIVKRLDGLSEETRNELLVSDLLNAYQVFYFMFRTDPGDLVRERLDLNPASALRGGLLVAETDLLEMYFGIKDAQAVVAISDGDRIVAAFSGKGAYEQGIRFLENPEWQ